MAQKRITTAPRKDLSQALGKRQEATGTAALKQLHQVIAQPYPQTIVELFTAPLLHDLTCDPKDMKKLVLQLVK
ncbi:hypothetical protein [Ligilactobacillus murinus]|uniref:hypothetical protein n=1 Tax=Ligilactobacillus murinus TaxID=1622 RepID=UPI001F03CC54|nr:hypothetical protein [Ligilactobacillus murinus]